MLRKAGRRKGASSPWIGLQAVRTYRKQGTRVRDEDKLCARYEAAVLGKYREERWVTPHSLADATGDQLAEDDAELAAHAYGLAGAPRPAVKLRSIYSEMFGDELSGITDMAIWFQDAQRWSALRAAGEAIALSAERNHWIGVRAPVSFDRALELVRKSVGRVRKLGRLRYVPAGWTGRYLFVMPAPGMVVRMPAPYPIRTNLPLEGTLMRDDAFWRRCIRDGDVILLYEDEKHPTRLSVVTPGWAGNHM